MTATAHSVVTPGDRLRRLQRELADHPLIGLTFILLLVGLLLQIVSPGYWGLNSAASTLQLASILGVIAAGQTLVLLTAGVDLSVASTASASAYVMASYSHAHGPIVGILIGLGIGLLIGVVNGIGVGIFRVQPLIMTLGVGGVVGGALTVYVQKFSAGAPVVPDFVSKIGAGRFFTYLPISVVLIWVPLSLLLVFGLKYSGLGRSIVAVGDNPIACRLSGVRVWQVLLVTYSISGILAAVAGVILAGNNGAVDQQLATSYLLTSVAAAVIGGTSIFGGSGGYAGTILGAIILTVLDSLLAVMDASQAVRYILYGAIILLLTWGYTRISGGQ